jgi:trimeric autotransporter adhesin
MKRGLNHKNSLPDPEFGRESSESARAIHYVVQKDTLMTYEKGVFAQADPGIVSGSTIERKKMSTKTIYKRIALVAVAALGAGLLSVAPANAATTAQANATTVVTSITLANGSGTNTVNRAVVVNVGATTVVAAASTQIAFKGVLTSFPAGGFVQVTSRALLGNGSIGTPGTLIAGSAVATTTDASAIALGAEAGESNVLAGTVTASSTAGIGAFQFTPTIAGDYTMTVWNEALGGTSGVIDPLESRQTITITVAAASAYSGALSTMHSILGDGGVAADATTNAVPLVVTATRANTTRGAITITLRNAANATMTSGNTISAVMSGVGGFGSTTVTADTPGATDCSATTVERVKTLAADAVNTLTLCSDGNSGVGTVTVSVTNAAGVTTVLGTKTITYFGTVATLSATVLQGIATPGVANGNNTQNAATQATLALTPAVVVVARDANGVIVPGLTVVGTPADLTIVASSTTAGAVNGTTDKNGPGHYNFAVTGGAAANVGKSTTIVYSTVVSSTLTISSAPVTISLGGTPAAVTWALDKTSYAPGAPVVITVNVKDAAGNNVGDNTYANLFAGATVLGGNITGATPAASVEVVGGKATFTAFAPGTTGSFTITNTLAASAGAANVGKVLTGAIVVTAPANPEITALTTLVNSLIAKINALNNLVVKIQRKVRA